MPEKMRSPHQPSWSVGVFLGGLVLGSSPAVASDQDPAWTDQTQVIISLATDDVPSVRSRFDVQPPTIVLEFPAKQVIGSLPERSVIPRGIVEEVAAFYGQAAGVGGTRWIHSLRLKLRATADYSVRTAACRIMLAIRHPPLPGEEALQVNLGGSSSPSPLSATVVGERFRAMQEALMQAGARPEPLR